MDEKSKVYFYLKLYIQKKCNKSSRKNNLFLKILLVDKNWKIPMFPIPLHMLIMFTCFFETLETPLNFI